MLETSHNLILNLILGIAPWDWSRLRNMLHNISFVTLLLSLIISKQRVPSSMPLLLTEEAPLLVFQSLLRSLLRTMTWQHTPMPASATKPATWFLPSTWTHRIYPNRTEKVAHPATSISPTTPTKNSIMVPFLHFHPSSNMPCQSPHGYSWFDGLLRNPRSGVQTPQVLGYSPMRVALILGQGFKPLQGVGVPHVQSGYTLA